MTSKSAFETYEPSGVVPAKGVVLTLLFGCLAGLVLGVVYAYVTVYNPLFWIFAFFAYLFNAVAPVAGGFLVGAMAGFGATLGDIRSPKVVALLGGLSGFAFLWMSWMFWLHIQGGGWTWDGVHIVQTLANVASNKMYILFDSAMPAWAAWSIWSIEALCVLGGAAVGGLVMAEDPFCEACGEWTEELDDDKRRISLNMSTDEVAERVVGGDLECLVHDPSASDVYQLSFHQCPSCSESAFLSVKTLEITFDEDGDPSESLTNVITYLKIGASGVERLNQAGAFATEAAQDENPVYEIDGDLPPPSL